MKPAFAAVLTILAGPAWAQFPEPVGPPQLLAIDSTQFPTDVDAASERGESSLASYSLGSSNVYRLGPHGLTIGQVTLPAQAALAPGRDDGTWSCHDAYSSGHQLICQLYSRAWAPLAPALTVHSSPSSMFIEIASDAQGNLAVAWREFTAVQDIKFRLLDASGTGMGPIVPAFDGSAIAGLKIAYLSSGGLVLLTERGTTPHAVWAQLADSAGVLSAPFQLSTPPAGDQDGLQGAVRAGSGFAVSWTRYTASGPDLALFQRFGPNGVALSPPALFPSGDPPTSSRMGCDGWGRCVMVGIGTHSFYDAQGQLALGPVAGGAAQGLAVSPSGAFTAVWSGSPPSPVESRTSLPPPYTFAVWAERYQGPPKGDLDADRSTDIVLQSTSTRALELWAMNGTARSGAPRPIAPVPAPGWQAVGVDDFDGDWRQDLVLWNSSSGAVEFWSMGGADGTTRLGVHPLTGVAALAPPWRPAATGDFDGDGKPDLLWRNESTGLLRLWTLDGSAYRGSLTPDPPQAPGLGWRVAAAADFDNDGRRDLLWYDPASSSVAFWYLDTALRAVGGQGSNPPSGGGSSWHVVGAGEFGAGTGRARVPAVDLLWRSQIDGRLVVWHMNSQGTVIGGGFTQPDAPDNPLDWNVVGPR